jgi:hypothetical protein
VNIFHPPYVRELDGEAIMVIHFDTGGQQCERLRL